MRQALKAALCALALFLLVACAGTGGPPSADPMLQRQLARAEQALVSSPAPRVIYAGFAMHSQSKAFASDVRLGAQFARRLDPQAIVFELSNPALFQGGDLPLASRANVEYLLAQLSQLAREQDKLVLLFSTHGLAGLLSVNVSNREDKPLQAAELRQWTDGLRGKATLMLISACFSGSLIEPLRDADRIIYTAAARGRSSFGCNFHSDGTFFIDGLLRQDGTDELSLSQLMSNAQASIGRREAALDIKLPSMPQAFVGSNMRALTNLPLRELREARVLPGAR